MSYGQPPYQQDYYGAPPNQNYGQEFPPQPGFPQQHGHGGPQYQQGPPQQGGYAQGGYAQGGYGPPPGQYFQPPPTPPSPGYDPRATATGDASRDADALRGAMKGFGTNEATLISVLSKPDPLQMALLRNTYSQRLGRNLEMDIDGETSSHFREALLALVRGPLAQDVHNVHKAIDGLGTKESLLNDVLLGRSNADMRAIKQAYHEKYHRTLEADVKADLSLKTARLFVLITAANRAEESAPIIPQDLDRDCGELHRAADGRIGTDEMTVCSIFASRSDGQLRAIAQHYQQKYAMTLEKVVEKEFSGHMKDALLLMLGRATDRAMTDAVQMEDSMKGMGTRDTLLVNRVVRAHWDRMHLDQVKRAYQFRYKKDLISRVRGESSGDYNRLLVACLS